MNAVRVHLVAISHSCRVELLWPSLQLSFNLNLTFSDNEHSHKSGFCPFSKERWIAFRVLVFCSLVYRFITQALSRLVFTKIWHAGCSSHCALGLLSIYLSPTPRHCARVWPNSTNPEVPTLFLLIAFSEWIHVLLFRSFRLHFFNHLLLFNRRTSKMPFPWWFRDGQHMVEHPHPNTWWG